MEDEGTIEVGGRRIGWLARGPADGRVVGWLHGQPGSRRDIAMFADELLVRHGIRLLAIDRAGYGETDPVGLDRREVARDLFAVADHLGVSDLPVMAVSMGGVYALTAAALAPDRVSRLVLLSPNVLPYDDPVVVADLSAAEQDDLDLLRRGGDQLEQAYAEGAAAAAADPLGLLRRLAASWGPREQTLVDTPWGESVASSVAFGLSSGHRGMLDDGLRTIRPLEIDLAAVRCPVRIVHGTADDLEPYANVERAAARLADCVVLTLPGLGHFAPWLWPDLAFALLSGA